MNKNGGKRIKMSLYTVGTLFRKGRTNIGGSSFYGCNSLININIPASVENIGVAAFTGCGALDDSIRQNIETLNSDAFKIVE